MNSSSDLLGPDGPFQSLIPGFSVRDVQQQLAGAVEMAIDKKETLIAESGTGTGKTFAYLVPALSGKKRTIISSFTINLQEQIVNKDLPVVCEALNIFPKIKLLKGRSNYLCMHRFEQQRRQPDLVDKIDKNLNEKMAWIDDWADRTEDGDISNLSKIASNDEAWEKVTSTNEACIRHRCDWWKNCYANRAWHDSKDADILVVNHSILCLDLLKWEGVEKQQGLLKGADVVIVDEAHRLPDVAAGHMGVSLALSEINKVIRDIQDTIEKTPEIARETDDKFKKFVAEIDTEIIDLVNKAKKTVNSELKEGPLSAMRENKEFLDSMRNVFEWLDNLENKLTSYYNSYSTLEKCLERIQSFHTKYNQLIETAKEIDAEWYEVSKEGLKLSRVPLEPGSKFGDIVKEYDCSWIFTSATLAVGKDFSHFQNRLGIKFARAEQWPSPFRYDEQALLFLPPNMPDPNLSEFNSQVADVVRQIVPLVTGGTFVLFTSYKAMQEVNRILSDELDCPLLVQNSGSRSSLLKRFKEHGHSVLLGTTSFWEGVDVKGSALSCVIISKLPFTPHERPMMKARIEYLNERGDDPFKSWQVPETALALKQGAGRLIRDFNDRGVLAICDPRLTSKSYGATILETLAQFPQTSELSDVREFFEK